MCMIIGALAALYFGMYLWETRHDRARVRRHRANRADLRRALGRRP